MIDEVVKRDPQKQVNLFGIFFFAIASLFRQILLINYDDDTLKDIQMKVSKLRDDPHIDVNTRANLWNETVHVRRKHIRDQPIPEVLEEFPGYTDPVLVSIFITCFLFVLNKFISLTDF